MKDYKNVKVPRKYRATTNRVTVRRAAFGSGFRIRPSRPRGRLVKFLAGVVITAGCWLGWLAYQSLVHAEVFQIAGVDVKGVRRLTENEIKGMVHVFTGQNIFRVDLEAAARQARAHPWVKDVRIERRLPNRISMVFTERVPAAVLDTGRGRYLVDSEGVVIEKIVKQNIPPSPLPLVMVSNCAVRPGARVETGGMAEALMLLAELSSRRGWRLEDVTVKANSAESLTILYANHEFKVGRGNYSEKLRRLSEIMADVKQRGLQFSSVDLRSERQAAVMVRK